MNTKEKMLELIQNKKNKGGNGRSKQMAEPKNNIKNMRKGPKIYNK